MMIYFCAQTRRKVKLLYECSSLHQLKLRISVDCFVVKTLIGLKTSEFLFTFATKCVKCFKLSFLITLDIKYWKCIKSQHIFLQDVKTCTTIHYFPWVESFLLLTENILRTSWCFRASIPNFVLLAMKNVQSFISQNKNVSDSYSMSWFLLTVRWQMYHLLYMWKAFWWSCFIS